MSIHEYFEEIESFAFGAQFSIFSGFSLVLSDISENETLQTLISELRSDSHKTVVLSKRIRFLLRNRQADDQMAFDGSLTSYLYCLWKVDLDLGYRASQAILNVPGLWWSAKLALLVRKEFLAEQFSESVHFASDKREPVPYTLTGLENPSLQNTGEYSYSPGLFGDSRVIVRRCEFQRASTDQFKVQNASWVSSFERHVIRDISNPTQEVEISIAS